MRSFSSAQKGLFAVLALAVALAFGAPAAATALEGALVSAGQDGGAASDSVSAQQPAADYSKSEIVYSTLDARGAEQASYVVNRFEVRSAGSIVDFGDYLDVQNLTDTRPLGHVGREVSFDAPDGLFFYQGDAGGARLPWDVSLTYLLNGSEVSPNEIAGAQGKVEVRMSVRANGTAPDAFYKSYMMQITFTLPGDACANVKADGATVASSGTDRTVAFTVLPGHDGDFALSCDANGFHMPGAQLVALPYSSVIDMPDASGMVDGMSQLTNAVSQLASGSEDLAFGVGRFASGIVSMADFADSLMGSLDGIDANAEDVEKALAALTDIAKMLDSVTDEQIKSLESVPGELTRLAEVLNGIADQLDGSQDTIDRTLERLGASLEGIPAVGAADIAHLQELANEAGTPQDAQTAADLAATYRAAVGAKASYAEVQDEIDKIKDLMSSEQATAERLRALADKLDDAAESLEKALDDGLVDKLIAFKEQSGSMQEAVEKLQPIMQSLPGDLSGMRDQIGQLRSGAMQLAGGADALAGGMGQLNEATISIPDTMRAEIGKMTAEFDFPPFDPTSFAAPENSARIAEVQFVVTTGSVDVPKSETEPEVEPELTLWDRLVALFS